MSQKPEIVNIKRRSTEEMVVYLTGKYALLHVDLVAIRSQYAEILKDTVPKANFNRLVNFLVKKLGIDKKEVEKIKL